MILKNESSTKVVTFKKELTFPLSDSIKPEATNFFETKDSSQLLTFFFP